MSPVVQELFPRLHRGRSRVLSPNTLSVAKRGVGVGDVRVEPPTAVLSPESYLGPGRVNLRLGTRPCIRGTLGLFSGTRSQRVLGAVWFWGYVIDSDTEPLHPYTVSTRAVVVLLEGTREWYDVGTGVSSVPVQYLRELH